MEALPDTPHQSHGATTQKKECVTEQLADILIEISKHPLPRSGSLIQGNRRIEVGPFESNRFITLHRYGPFEDALTYFVQTAEQYLDLIADDQLYNEYPADAFLFYTMLREYAHILTPEHQHPRQFFLRHVDDKGDHILVDQEGNITGMIDWQFARCVPASEAFGPSYFTADLDALYSGRIGVTDDDRKLAGELRKRGGPILARYMEQNDFARVLCHCLGSGLTADEAGQVLAGVMADLKRRNLWQEDILVRCEKDPRWDLVKTL
jgi:hypothetical protein